MNIIVSSRFRKDLYKLNDPDLDDTVVELIESFYGINQVSEITNILKMKGYKNAYRIRIGNYRMGVLINENTIEIARVAHRKDIYKLFP
jgi:mRNA interferase RelE/StbE